MMGGGGGGGSLVSACQMNSPEVEAGEATAKIEYR
jgi:hypothetical protein